MVGAAPTRVDLGELKKFVTGFLGRAPTQKVSSGVGVEGEAASYALVWEYGNLRQKKKGPRTVWGTGGFGDPAWMSSQAPTGYVRVNEPLYWQAINRKLDQIDTDKDVAPQLDQAAREIADECAAIIRDHAPEDTGKLKGSTQAWYPGDPRLDDEGETTLIIET